MCIRDRSDYLIEDGSFLRIQNVTLGYTFPKVSFLRSLRIYATAQTLLTITGYSGYNPEVNSQGQSNLQDVYKRQERGCGAVYLPCLRRFYALFLIIIQWNTCFFNHGFGEVALTKLR